MNGIENQKLIQTTAVGFQLDSLQKNLITLTRVTFTENDLKHGVILNHSNAQTTPYSAVSLVSGAHLCLRQMQKEVSDTPNTKNRVE